MVRRARARGPGRRSLSAAEAAATAPPERDARERILAAAVERIARDGIDEVRIARIAMAAGVSTSLVHYHFETREALLEQALEYSYELAGDVRLAEGEGDALDSVQRLAAMIDQFLPYPGMLERDWILWVELWLRAVRHPDMRPTAARLYARMRHWFAAAIAAGIERGELRAAAEPERLADRVMALADGYGVRVLFGDMEVDHARREIWAALAGDLGLPAEPPPPLDPAGPPD
jgi:AcrR family transcriptional regulator